MSCMESVCFYVPATVDKPCCNPCSPFCSVSSARPLRELSLKGLHPFPDCCLYFFLKVREQCRYGNAEDRCVGEGGRKGWKATPVFIPGHFRAVLYAEQKTHFPLAEFRPLAIGA